MVEQLPFHVPFHTDIRNFILFILKSIPKENIKKYLSIVSLILLIQIILDVFLKDSQSIADIVEIFSTFSVSSELKPNLTKCKVAGIGALKGFQLAVYAIKILGTSHTRTQ